MRSAKVNADIYCTHNNFEKEEFCPLSTIAAMQPTQLHVYFVAAYYVVLLMRF